jgi:hypothetical protein
MIDRSMERSGERNIAGLMNPSRGKRGKSEKRDYPRLALRLPTEYSLEGSPDSHIGYTADLCEGGLLIHIPEEISSGQRLTVRVYYYSHGIESVQALAEVCRVNRFESSVKEYICALKFIDLPAGELKKFRHLLKILS